ncbi:DUF2325 domain-containing protein [soil metagenome]
MLNPPFRLSVSAPSSNHLHSDGAVQLKPVCCDEAHDDDGAAPNGRTRLSQLDMHFHCSVIGTCLTTAELRKLLGRFIDVQGQSDLDIHHEAVRLSSRSAPVTKALQKALDHRHAPSIQRYLKAPDAAALQAHWDEALRQGEVPGAYWAVLTHRKSTTELRQRVFGDVHMLSHLVGAANRADIRRLVALEHENAELHDRLDRQQIRSQEVTEEKNRRIALLEQEVAQASILRVRLGELESKASSDVPLHPTADASALVALQTERRERAEQVAAAAAAQVSRLTEELAHLQAHAIALSRELGAMEGQLRDMSDGESGAASFIDSQIRGRRILYVGGRPSTAPAIRDLVLRHGGEIQRHGGGLEDRKGLLASAVAWAEVVVFPVDCIDHDSAGNLKRLCARQQVPFIPLRGAGVGCFAAAFSTPPENEAGTPPESGPAFCIRHG